MIRCTTDDLLRCGIRDKPYRFHAKPSLANLRYIREEECNSRSRRWATRSRDSRSDIFSCLVGKSREVLGRIWLRTKGITGFGGEGQWREGWRGDDEKAEGGEKSDIDERQNGNKFQFLIPISQIYETHNSLSKSWTRHSPFFAVPHRNRQTGSWIRQGLKSGT